VVFPYRGSISQAGNQAGNKGGSAMHRVVWTVAIAVILIVSVIVLASCSAMNPRTQTHEKIKGQEDDSGLYRNNFFNSLGNIEGDENLYAILKEPNIYPVNVLLYFYNPDKNRLDVEKRAVSVQDMEQLLEQVVNEFIQGPRAGGLQPVVPPSVKVESVQKYGNVVSVYLSKEFLESRDLAIARAALVNTVLEFQSAKYVNIYIEGKEFTYDGKDDGLVLGLLERYPNEIDRIRERETEIISQGDFKRIKRYIYFQDRDGRFLIPEIRDIPIGRGRYVEAIVGEMIKGPTLKNEGLYPTMPSGTRLVDVRFVEDADLPKGVELYFSKEFKSYFDKDTNSETMIVGSLVYNLVGLPGVQWIKIYYQNEKGDYVDTPLASMNLARRFDKDKILPKLGRRIKVYFSDENVMSLVPEYRVVCRDAKDIANEILKELIQGPMEKGHIEVIPQNISIGDINVYIRGQTVFVDLPSKLNQYGLGSAGETMALYAIVNSLTDPVNTDSIKQVQFLVDGKVTKEFGHMSLADPFVRNPGLIKD
jgi:spore germination protein GerM